MKFITQLILTTYPQNLPCFELADIIGFVCCTCRNYFTLPSSKHARGTSSGEGVYIYNNLLKRLFIYIYTHPIFSLKVNRIKPLRRVCYTLKLILKINKRVQLQKLTERISR